MSQPTAVDAASALALIADLYRQLTAAQAELAEERAGRLRDLEEYRAALIAPAAAP